MTILVTRPAPAGDALVSRLHALGRRGWSLPLIEFAPGRELAMLPAHVRELRRGDLIFVLSQQVIGWANHTLQQQGGHWPTDVDYYAIGRTTAMALHSACGQRVTWPHERETSDVLIQLPALQQLSGKRALILRGNGGRELLGETLRVRGADVHFCECYQRCDKTYNGYEEARRWRERQVDTLVVTSGEMLHQLFALIPPGDRTEWLLRCRLVVVSERLATRARELGWQTIVVADSADNDALLRALLQT
ncbi:uroporphyrinogen-III synthase [Pantoea sp. 1.19]|uniref:uroporphyrinogen-III synthase n=1 Tax=Pantoea sp. 1.19 TaxID=1925589 RepID=UPI00094915E2|nr:uroporphyrinogen-III synthase [Pantoea sp. 1.19]